MSPVTRQGRLLGPLLAAVVMLGLLGSCSRFLGWGVLLWSSEDPPVPSGTVLPVYIRSNIDRVWVVGIPETLRQPESALDKFEIPLAQLDFAGSRRKAQERAADFAALALSYAETLQDGLPIRENPDNSARRVYRLRLGELIKILARVEGTPAINASGNPLPGDWYRVLTSDGSTGFCFSYRLRIFEHSGGPLVAASPERAAVEDPELEELLSKTWSPHWYGAMLDTRRLNLEELSRRWYFSPGIDTGIARIYLPSLDRSFPYTGILPEGNRSWRFEGTPLRMSLRSSTMLELQVTEEGGARRTLSFTALPAEVDDLIMQESARREGLYQRIYTQGPVFTSANYGTLSFGEDERFSWSGYDLLVPRIIPPQVPGNGRVFMDLFLESSLQDRYDGAFSLIFDGIGDAGTGLRFMYTLDAQGFRLEYVPAANLEGVTVLRRASAPTVIYFFPVEQPRFPGGLDGESRPSPEPSAAEGLSGEGFPVPWGPEAPPPGETFSPEEAPFWEGSLFWEDSPGELSPAEASPVESSPGEAPPGGEF